MEHTRLGLWRVTKGPVYLDIPKQLEGLKTFLSCRFLARVPVAVQKGASVFQLSTTSLVLSHTGSPHAERHAGK